MTTLVATLIDLNGRPHYLHSGWFLISVANLVVIVAMVVVFVLAIVLPFPRDRADR
jgi:type IV secretory pathway component VirB8